MTGWGDVNEGESRKGVGEGGVGILEERAPSVGSYVGVREMGCARLKVEAGDYYIYRGLTARLATLFL